MRNVYPIIGRQVIYNLYCLRLFRKEVLEACHDEISHLGIERMDKFVER